MKYEDDEEVKTVKTVVLVKMTYTQTLMGVDYNESDGTDEGAVKSCLLDVGYDEWDEAEIHSVVSVVEV